VTSVDELAEAAAKRAQLDDFGGDSWREGLSILVDTLETFPGVQESGRGSSTAWSSTRSGIGCAWSITRSATPRCGASASSARS
jgi:hypothetical protein